MSKSIVCIIKEPGKDAYVDLVPNELKDFQHLVGGYIEVLRVTTDLIAIVNEEGILLDLPENFLGLRGTIVFCAPKGEAFGGIKASAVPRLLGMINGIKK